MALFDAVEIYERIHEAKSQLSLEEINKLRSKLIARCLVEFNRAMGFAADHPDDVERRVCALKPVLEPIPVEKIYDAYLYAMQNREGTFQLSSVEWLKAWDALKGGASLSPIETPKNRMLPENAKGCCRRCFGKGYELFIAQDGRPANRKCDHRPPTEEEIADHEAGRKRFLEMQERMRQTLEENSRIASNVTPFREKNGDNLMK